MGSTTVGFALAHLLGYYSFATQQHTGFLLPHFTHDFSQAPTFFSCRTKPTGFDTAQFPLQGPLRTQQGLDAGGCLPTMASGPNPECHMYLAFAPRSRARLHPPGKSHQQPRDNAAGRASTILWVCCFESTQLDESRW
jgi:hypothetical protein